MAQFDESKVINALHTEKAEVGKKYWYADNIARLKCYIEQDSEGMLGELKAIDGDLFDIGSSVYYLLHPYEEPPKKRMTYRQLSEWLAKGNGQMRYKNDRVNSNVSTYIYYPDENSNDFVDAHLIRSWDSEEWIEPTVDIYERDCKGGKE